MTLTLTDPPVRPDPILELDEWTRAYRQDGDGSAGPREQVITIKQEDAGGGPFWIIETDRWAFDSVEDLVELLTKAGVGRAAAA